MGVERGDLPDSVPAILSFKSWGQPVRVNAKIKPVRTSEIEEACKPAEGVEFSMTEFCKRALLLVVIEWDYTAYPLTLEGLADLEDARPGALFALWSGYQKARAAELEKN